uniref:Uncharacterized protein n=1 Tax=viral metagenome TaxID=1070528 RepID=A0A6H2A1S1_9ZZZZ
MRNKKVIKFPDKEYILRCHRCKINAFYIILNSESYSDIKGIECAECGWHTPLESLHILENIKKDNR